MLIYFLNFVEAAAAAAVVKSVKSNLQTHLFMTEVCYEAGDSPREIPTD